MKSIYILAASSLLLCTAACSQVGPEGGNNPYKALELSTKGAEFVQKGSSFTFEYIDRINSESKGDYIISPLSMQFLLGMILDGAQGATADEICSVLGYGKGEVDAVNEYCLSMLEQLPKMDKKTKLNIANAIFVDEGWPLLGSYKSDVGKYYRAEVSNLVFSNGPASLKVINGWCSKHTEGLVPKILDEVSPDILAYLLNALYFKSQWSEKFSKALTAEELFTDESGTKSTVKMMKQEKSYNYTENDVFKAVTIPYGKCDIDGDLYGKFDYAALGHIHMPQTIKCEKGTVRYSGSPLAYSFSESDMICKSVTIAELREKGDADVQTVELSPLHKMRTIKGAFDEMIRDEGLIEARKKDYLRVIIFRPVPELRPAGRRHQSR